MNSMTFETRYENNLSSERTARIISKKITDSGPINPLQRSFQI